MLDSLTYGAVRGRRLVTASYSIKGEYEFELDCFKVSDSFFVSICLDKYSVCNLNASTNISPEKRNLAESMVRNRAIIVYETPEKKKFKKVVDFLESPLYTNKRAKEHEAHKKCRSGGIGRRAGFRCLWSLRPCGFKSHLLHLFCFTEITCLLEFTLWDDYKFIFDSKTNKCYTSR